MTDLTTVVATGLIAALCGLVWYRGFIDAVRCADQPRYGRPPDFWLPWAARVVVLTLFPGIGALFFGWLFLTTCVQVAHALSR